jgi:HAD superfamily hydrolase (TIGR01509 family)
VSDRDSAPAAEAGTRVRPLGSAPAATIARTRADADGLPRELVEGRVDAVVFDCDGTLADSEPLAWRSWEVVLARYGHALAEADFAAMIGRSYAQAHAGITGRIPSLPGPDALWAELAEILFELIETRLRPFDDAVSTVRLLADLGVPIAVASSSPRSRVDVTLRALGLAHLFPVTVAGDEVRDGKPAPDLFLAAADGLGVPAARCLAIEDSPAGVASAKAAGMRTIAVCRGETATPTLLGADAVVRRLDPRAIARMAGRRTSAASPGS